MGETGTTMAKRRETKAGEEVARTLRAARNFVSDAGVDDQPMSEEEARVGAEHRASLPRPSPAEIARIAKNIGKRKNAQGFRRRGLGVGSYIVIPCTCGAPAEYVGALGSLSTRQIHVERERCISSEPCSSWVPGRLALRLSDRRAACAGNPQKRAELLAGYCQMMRRNETIEQWPSFIKTMDDWSRWQTDCARLNKSLREADPIIIDYFLSKNPNNIGMSALF